MAKHRGSDIVKLDKEASSFSLSSSTFTRLACSVSGDVFSTCLVPASYESCREDHVFWTENLAAVQLQTLP